MDADADFSCEIIFKLLAFFKILVDSTNLKLMSASTFCYKAGCGLIGGHNFEGSAITALRRFSERCYASLPVCSIILTKLADAERVFA